MKRNVLKADLHVHSKYSTRPSEWFLRRIGCDESYTDPLLLYEIAIKRGMDLVTITDHEINGVATTLKRHVELAQKHNQALTLITCGPESETPGVKNFSPIGMSEMPLYPDIKMFYPPLLEMLNYCYEQDFTHIHSATPGPIGLAALAIAYILQLPICGTYHTALPQYAQQLSDDQSLEELVWKYTIGNIPSGITTKWMWCMCLPTLQVMS